MKRVHELKDKGRYLDALKRLGKLILEKTQKDNSDIVMLSSIAGTESNVLARDMLDDFIEKIDEK